MSRYRHLPLPVLLFLCILYTLQTASGIPPAETDSAMAYLKVLSDPELFAGRKGGDETGAASQEWIAGHFERWGLQPLLGDNLLHKFDMLATVEKKAKLLLLDTELYGDIEFLLGFDYNIAVNSGSGKVTAPIVFVGHGISKPDKGWDDYGDTNVEGKIVVIIRGKPANGENWDKEYSRTYLVNEAVDRGAVAVLIYMGENVVGGATIMEEAYHSDLPIAIVGKTVLRHLFWGTGFTQAIYERVLKTEPRVLELNKQVRIVARVERIEDAFSYNVAGVVPGTDPELAHEAVILGGHGDHVGHNSLGHVYPGADDNGSGASSVMELARVFAANPQPRTMIFMVFGSEEQGLLGSEAISAELPDRYDYITMVNLDMGGRGEGITGIGGGNAIPAVWYDFYSSLSDSMQGQIKANRAWGGFSSDHAHFREAGIPAFTCYSKGSHDHYHTTEDTYESIDPRAIEGCLSSIGLWLEALASHPEPLFDEYQAERVVWQRGYALRWAELNAPESDFGAATTSARNGYSATVLTTYPPTNEVERELFVETLDHYRDTLELDEALNLGSTLSDVTGNAYNLKGTVFLAVDGDDFTSADSTRMDYWNALGLRWIKLDDPNAWLSGETVRFDKEGIVKAWKRLDSIIQMPLADADSWLPLVDELSTALFVGEWSDFAALSEETQAELKESGAHLLVMVPHEDLPAAASMVDKLHDLRVHLQPVSEDYTEPLVWVRLALETDIEKDTFLDWIARHYGTW